jgi:uncharacterized tellurite resistance protein B-like protein
MSIFIATAGIIVANLDDKVTQEEFEHIIRNLSSSHIFPKAFLDRVVQNDVDKLFEASVNKILELSPGLKSALLQYMISMVLADKDIADIEVNFIYHIGQQLGMSPKEISVTFASMIQQNFTPSLDAIS